MDQVDGAERGRIQGAVDLEDEDRVRIALPVQRQVPGQAKSGVRAVDAGGERLPGLVSGEIESSGSQSGGVAVGDRQVGLRLRRLLIAGVRGTSHGGVAGEEGAGADPEITGYHRGGAGDGGAKNRVGRCAT
jgi:hypothetical protein